MESGRVRISDIAQELGLSTATVSNVIHGKTGKVSDETVRRVQALLEEREYIPNMAGILLAQNRSGIIGVVINPHEKYEGHPLEDAFIASSLNYLSLEIEGHGKFMMVKTAAQAQEIIRFSSMWNLEGLVLIGFCRQDYVWLRQHMRIPFVVYDGDTDAVERICNLCIDNFGGGRLVGELFRSLGHRRALCISDNRSGVDWERYRGFRAGLGPVPGDFLEIPMTAAKRLPFYEARLEALRRYTAIFAVSDYYAVELIRFLREHRVRVPGEISVAGFDDTPVASQLYPTLTSVRQDGALRAKTAMEKLIRLRAQEDPGSVVCLPVTLIERESTAAPGQEPCCHPET